jgi:hypothetical protein
MVCFDRLQSSNKMLNHFVLALGTEMVLMAVVAVVVLLGPVGNRVLFLNLDLA